jgi:hypothetical protein
MSKTLSDLILGATVATIFWILVAGVAVSVCDKEQPQKQTTGYVFNNPPAPPVVETFYPDDLVWHKYLKRAGVVTRTHYGDEQVSVIPVMVKGEEITAIRQGNEIVEYWTTALIFKTNKENFVLLSKLRKENK